MASQTQGIQQLLSAEKKAEEKVNHARKRKAIKLKKAKEEATAEVVKFREQKDKDFKEYEKQFMGSKESNAAVIEESTQQKIADMEQSVVDNKDKVIEYLLGQVFDVTAKLHQNFRGEA